MAKLYLGETEITPVITVEGQKNEIDLYPQEDIEIIQNEYYSKNTGTVVEYNGWDRTALIDVSDVEYVAINLLTWPAQYTVYQGSINNLPTFYIININNELFRLYNVSNCTSIGFSDKRSQIAALKLYKVKENNISLPKVLIDNQQIQARQTKTLKSVRNVTTITYPEPTEA